MPAQNPSTGLELVLNACESDLQLVLSDDEQLVCAQTWGVNSRATEILAPALQQLFSLTHHSFAELRRIGVICGPGSFTGIRLCIATAAALMRTTKAQLGALDYMRALATTAAMDEQLLWSRKICVLTHARRGLVHFSRHLCHGPVIPAYEMEPASLASIDDAVRTIAAIAAGEPEPVVICGSGLARNPKALDALRSLEAKGHCQVLDRLVRPSVSALLLLGRHGDYFRKDLEPVYLRPCDAVENLPSLAARMGCDPEASVRMLDELLAKKTESLI